MTNATNKDLTPRGRITCILGPMFSGKTTELLRLHDRQILARKKCVLVKYAGDDRYDKELVATHNKIIGTGVTVKAFRLSDIRYAIFDPEVEVVAIDEGQFYEDMSATCEELARNGKTVYVAALNGTFARQPFEQVSLLLPNADEVRQLYAVCMRCGDDANFSFRSTTDKKVEVIGGVEAYRALCRSCFYEESRQRDGAENDPLVTKTKPKEGKKKFDSSIDSFLPRKRRCAVNSIV